MFNYLLYSMRKPCCEKAETKRGAWSKQEDQKLIDYIRRHGQGCWNSLPKAAGLRRCGKSCRLRWRNYLRPDLKRGSFGEDEVDLIIRLHALLGNRWSLIAGRLPGRTDNEVKNYWNTHIKKMLSNINYLHPKRSSHDQNLKKAGGATNTSVPLLVHPDARKPNLLIVSSSPPPSLPPPPPRKPQVEVNFHGILYDQDEDDDDEVASGSVSTGIDDIIFEESGLPDLNLDLTL